jgi:transcriptional regulator with XRE-family HTH domain
MNYSGSNCIILMRLTTFGQLVRRRREEKRYGLREAAGRIGITPTYLSKIERGEFKPPSEETIRGIARLLELDADDLIMLAGKIPSDLVRIILERPREMITLLRAASGLSAAELEELMG